MKSLLLFLSLLGLLFPLTAPAEVIDTSGNLRTLINDITSTMRDLARPDSDALRLPTPDEITAWREIIRALLAGNVSQAGQRATALAPSYKVVRFTEKTTGRLYYLLLEADPDGMVPIIERGWGTYIFDPDAARAMNIQIPHPIFDAGTDREGIEVFLQLGARSFFMSGTHRCANTESSPCNGFTTACGGVRDRFRISDVAHSLSNMFHPAYEEIRADNPATIAVQLHGNSTSGCPDVLISNTNSDFSVSEGGNIRRLVDNFDATDITLVVCDTAPQTCNLCGTDNVQGRFTNGSPEPCQTPARSTEEQFIHIEQSRAFRQDFQSLIDALRQAFPASRRDR